MKLGIVGLPNVGKSTLFNAITGAGAASANFPFCTIEPNVGMAAVPDERLAFLTEMYKPEKTIPAVIEFVDIAGLVKGASKGEGLGNKFLSHIREVDAICHVVRCFEDDNIIHTEGSPDPVRDMEVIDLELSLGDLEHVSKRIDKTQKLLKGDKKYQAELDSLTELRSHLDSGSPARTFDGDIPRDLSLLSSKPVIVCANMSESGFKDRENNKLFKSLKEHTAKFGDMSVLPICAKLEEELYSLPEDEKELFLEELGLKDSGLNRLIKASYALLGLISFLTAGPKEVRAWTIKRGDKAPAAAGTIHTDFERGFIRAEIVSFEDLKNSKSMAAAKEKGLVRSEGRDYIMRDGDVTLFRFNV